VNWKAVFGAMALFFMVILFNIFLHALVSLAVKTAAKFLFIGLADLFLLAFFIYVTGRDYDNFTKIKRRTTVRLVICVFVLILLGVSVAGYPFYYLLSIYSDEPETWELRISNETVLENQVLYMDDWLYISSSGNLTLVNSTISFGYEVYKPYGIYLSSEGRLYVKNCTITSMYKKEGYKIILHGEATIEESTIEYIWGDIRRRSDYGGLEIYSDNVLISNSMISNCTANGVYCEYASPQIISCNISHCGDDGIELSHSSPLIRNCYITNNEGYGIYIHDSNPKLESNVFVNNNKGDIRR
ncbi:MAG: right-handed parallel beta-helix repeat-containing protein, partial [Thermoplasmata archaeon]